MGEGASTALEAPPGATFDTFNYRMLSSLYWSAYTSDAHWVQFP